MDLGMSIIGFLLRYSKLIIKALVFTGLIFPALLKLFESSKGFPTYYWTIAWILCGIVFVQNIVRLVIKDRSFSFIQLIAGQGQSRKEKMATNPNIEKGLAVSAPMGFIFGRKSGKYVVKTEAADGHILTVGGAGSGKSSCLAIPSLLSW